MTWLAPQAVFDGERLRHGLALRVEQGRVADLAPLDPRMEAQALAGTVTPGLVDLQVNGGGGVLLNDDPTPRGMRAIAAAHRRFGTAAILPTLITDAPEALDRAAEAAIAAHGQDGVIGLHVEGPHISPQRRGTHALRFVRPLDERTLAAVRRLRARRVPVLVTVAPEAAGPEGIAALAATGAVVSLGHSDAGADAVRAALAAGASCFTHLFNAMSPLLHRAPGMVGAALNSHAPAGIICDGVHVADELVGLAVRARPGPDLTFLVSDAMPTVGGPDRFTLYGQELRLVDGRLVNAEGSLAGAHVTMAQSLARLVSHAGLAPEAALRMAVTVPARVIGRPDLAGLAGRALEDVLLLDAGLGLRGSLAALALDRPGPIV